MDDGSLENIVAVALERIRASLERGTPFMAQRVRTWMESLWPGHRLEEYWTHPIGFPLLLAPRWLEETLRRKSDSSFQLELIYSAINIYYQLRLTDNIMDGDVPTDRTLLPALGFFHTEFQRPYHRYFGHEHPFWDYFTKVWFHSAEVTMLDGKMSEFDLVQFQQIAGHKTCAATIPLAAVCYRYERTDVLPVWSRFLELYGWWSQMSNDTFGWLKDSQNNAATFFLSEARRRAYPEESVTEYNCRVMKIARQRAQLSHPRLQRLHSPFESFSDYPFLMHLSVRGHMKIISSSDRLLSNAVSPGRVFPIDGRLRILAKATNHLRDSLPLRVSAERNSPRPRNPLEKLDLFFANAAARMSRCSGDHEVRMHMAELTSAVAM